MLALDEPNDLPEALHRSRAECESLRLDLSEALGFVESLGAELWAASACHRTTGRAEAVRAPSPLNLLLQARTLMSVSMATLFETMP